MLHFVQIKYKFYPGVPWNGDIPMALEPIPAPGTMVKLGLTFILLGLRAMAVGF